MKISLDKEGAIKVLKVIPDKEYFALWDRGYAAYFADNSRNSYKKYEG